VSKKNPGYYTPQVGKSPEKINRAIEIISSRNGGLGATIEEIEKETGLDQAAIKKELDWGKHGNAGHPIIEMHVINDEKRYRHTHRYDPDQLQVDGR
jgi:hypothetical protein